SELEVDRPEEAHDAHHDQVDRDDVVQQLGHDEDEDAGDERDERAKCDLHLFLLGCARCASYDSGGTPSSLHSRATVSLRLATSACRWSTFALMAASSPAVSASPSRAACGDSAAEAAAGIADSPESRWAQRASRDPGCLASWRTKPRSASSSRKPSTAEMSPNLWSRSLLMRSSPGVC